MENRSVSKTSRWWRVQEPCHSIGKGLVRLPAPMLAASDPGLEQSGPCRLENRYNQRHKPGPSAAGPEGRRFCGRRICEKQSLSASAPTADLARNCASWFASEGLHVLAAGRTRSTLDAVVAEIESTGGNATAIAAEATNEADIISLFEQGGDDLELAIYNAGNNTPGRIVEMEASYFEQSWRVV
jgi:hypothetical protein